MTHVLTEVKWMQSGVEKNAREIKDHIEELYKSTGRKVVLLGHSKGGVDAAAACSMFWPQLKDTVVGVILVQSPYGGSPIASDILREGQIADAETRRIMEILICRIFKVNFWLEVLFYCPNVGIIGMQPVAIFETFFLFYFGGREIKLHYMFPAGRHTITRRSNLRETEGVPC